MSTRKYASRYEKLKKRNEEEKLIESCVGQFCPVFKLCVRKSGPILSPFIQMEPRRDRPNIQGEGKRISEDSQLKNGQNYHPRRGGACL